MLAPTEYISLKRVSEDAAMEGDDAEAIRNAKRTCTLCCNCGIAMEANPTAQCVTCLKQGMDVTADLARSIVLPHCKPGYLLDQRYRLFKPKKLLLNISFAFSGRECERYLGDSRWMKCERESRELLALCLKKVKGLKKGCQLIDANFVYTEEHCKRLKVKLLVQAEIHAGAALQQEVIIEYTIANKQCEDCCRSYTPHTWKAAVQVRQKVTHRRTLMHLEQLILTHQAHEKLLFVSQSPEGLDFHFGSKIFFIRRTRPRLQ